MVALDPGAEAMLILAGGEARRAARRERLRELLSRADLGALASALAERRLLALLGTRALDAAGDLAPEGFHDAVARAVAATRARGLAVESATRAATGALEAAGIRALPLKGTTLAQDAHGDLGLRATADVDVLVDASDLRAGVRALEAVGFAERGAPPRRDGLPDLHVALVHPTFPAVELHWRVHWYETEFSRELLAHARPGPDGLLRARRDDLAAALLLFHARDGLQGLRYPADVAAWWDRRGGDGDAASWARRGGDGDAASWAGPGRDAPGLLAGHARRHHALAPALSAAAVAVERVTGTPATGWLGDALVRTRPVAVATRLADWAQHGDRDQLAANISLVDALLGPRAALPGVARRELRLPGAPAAAAVAHPVKVGARCAWALWRVRGGREWARVPVT